MKKILLTSLAVAMLTFGAEARPTGLYLGGYFQTGSSNNFWFGNEDVFDNINLVATAGYSFRNGLRLEADFFQMDLTSPVGDAGSSFGLGMARALYDIRIDKMFIPYVGIGVGRAGLGNGVDIYRERFNMGGSLVAGLSVHLTDEVALDFQYSRLMFTVYNEWLGGRVRGGANDFRAGLRYHF